MWCLRNSSIHEITVTNWGMLEASRKKHHPFAFCLKRFFEGNYIQIPHLSAELFAPVWLHDNSPRLFPFGWLVEISVPSQAKIVCFLFFGGMADAWQMLTSLRTSCIYDLGGLFHISYSSECTFLDVNVEASWPGFRGKINPLQTVKLKLLSSSTF